MVELCYESIQWSPYVSPDPPDLVSQIGAAAAAGFPLVGIDIWSVAAHLADGGQLADLTAALRDHDVRCGELQALVVSDDEEATIDSARQIIDAALVLQPRFVMSGAASALDDATVANFARAGRMVNDAGFRLGIEFLPTLALDTIAKTRQLIDQTGIDAGVVVDSWHFCHGPDDWADLEALPCDEIAFVQFDDHPALLSDDLTHEMIHRRVFPGEGVLPLRRFVDTLRAKGFDGIVGVEIISEPLRALGHREFARRAHDTAAPFWR